MKTNYVAGFLFHGGSVALVLKDRPDFQKGKLNGIGGHIEDGESAVAAQVREFKEETGFETTEESWVPFCLLEGEDWSVAFYAMFIPEGVVRPELKNPDETEPVGWYLLEHCSDPGFPLLPNLCWLIPMAQDASVGLAWVKSR